MVEKSTRSGSLRRAGITTAYRAETGLRNLLTRVAVRRGWTPAVLPYSGYAGPHRARVLGRIVLAPAGADPAARRGIPGWQRLLTLESPGAQVEVELGGMTQTSVSDAAGLVDVVFDTSVTPGTVHAALRVRGREPVPANVHVASPEAAIGVVCDVDDTVWITGLRHPLRAAWRTLMGSSSTRQTVPGMARLLHRAVEGQHDPAVVYVSNGPWNLAGPVSRFLERGGFPPGALLMTDWGITPTHWFRDGRVHKSSALARLAEDLPWVRWVLIGDDGEHDPALYDSFAWAHPDCVVAIVLRQVLPGSSPGSDDERVGTVPVVRGPDGEDLLPRLDAVLREHASRR